MNKCINCGYFLNCKEAEGNKTECEKFIKRRKESEARRDDNNKSREK